MGYNEACKAIKIYSSFNKDIATIFNERSELEFYYHKSLSKLSNKIIKIVDNYNQNPYCILSENIYTNHKTIISLGINKHPTESYESNSEKLSILNAWTSIGEEIEKEAHLHKNLGELLEECVAKPLLSLSKTQNETRKMVEGDIERISKIYTDTRGEEMKYKLSSFDNHKNTEKLKEILEDTIVSNDDIAKNMYQDKDKTKNEEKLTKLLENCKKFDLLYHDTCLASERVRQDREYFIATGLVKLKALEDRQYQETLNAMSKYLALMTNIPDSHNKITNVLTQLISRVSKCIHEKMAKEADEYRDLFFTFYENSDLSSKQQYLLDFYAEDLINGINKNRRKHLLEKNLVVLKQDIENHKINNKKIEIMVNDLKTKSSDISNTTESLKTDVRRHLLSLHHTNNFLQASFYKVNDCCTFLFSSPKLYNPWGKYIETKRDNKDGIINSTLDIPLWDEELGIKGLKLNFEDLLNNHNNIPSSNQRPSLPKAVKNSTNLQIVESDTSMVKGCGLSFTNVGKALFGAKNYNFSRDKKPTSKLGDALTLRSLRRSSKNKKNVMGEQTLMRDNSKSETNLREMSGDRLEDDGPGGGLNSAQLLSRTPKSNPNNIMTTLQKRPQSLIVESYSREHDNNKQTLIPSSISQPPALSSKTAGKMCIVKYGYEAVRPDEITIKPGDIIEIFEKRADGWWSGRKTVPWESHVGVFPSTYVQEIVAS